MNYRRAIDVVQYRLWPRSIVPVTRSGAAAGLYSTMRFFGSIIGATIGGVILAQSLEHFADPLDAYHVAFWCWAAVAALAVVIIWPVSKHSS